MNRRLFGVFYSNVVLSVASFFWALPLFSQQQDDSPEPPAIAVQDISPAQEQMLIEYLKEHHASATSFVVSQFEQHDAILLGESHQVAENCEFVAALIQPLYEAGVRRLASEFTRSEFNDDLKKLVTDKDFDEELAIDLFRKGPWPTWGCKEYVGILRSAWSLNSKLPPDAEKFLVIGIEHDWRQYDIWFGNVDRMKQMLQNIAREKHMTAFVRECLDNNEKVLVHIGESHTNTKQGIRLGKVLTDEYGQRVKQVVLHHGWPGNNRQQAPLTDLLERIAATAGQGNPIGFDIVNSPLNRISDSNVIYWRSIRNARLGDFANSYIFLKPLDELHSGTWIPGFITKDRFEEARAIAVRARWATEDEAQTLEGLNAAMQKKFNHQQENSQ